MYVFSCDFNKKFSEQFDAGLDNQEKGMNTAVIITGFISLLVSCWLLIYTIVLLSFFEGSVLEMLPLLIFVFLVYGTYTFFPALLVSKNLSLNNRVDTAIKRKAIIERMELEDE